MLAIIRISGMVEVLGEIQEALFRARLRRKYALVLIKPTSEHMKLIKKIRNHVAYGDINKETLSLLIEKRAILKDSSAKMHVDKILEQIEKKKPESWDIKPFFRLHPPRGGIDAKKHFGVTKKAVLGDNKNKINDLIRRML